jgi:hypothetical protein
MIERSSSEGYEAPQPPTVNRFAVTLVATEAYHDWARSCFPDEEETTLADSQREPTVYLLPESDGELEELVRRHYLPMLPQELVSWCTDETAWPEDLSFRTFRSFFDAHVTTMVFDLGAEPLERDG